MVNTIAMIIIWEVTNDDYYHLEKKGIHAYICIDKSDDDIIYHQNHPVITKFFTTHLNLHKQT